MNRFYCFMFLLVLSICEASRLNMSRQKLEDKKILSSSNRKPLKSIKSLDGDIIDCVLVSHQPAFDHPSLKNHTIQMRPNYYPEELFGDDTEKSNFEPDTEDDIIKPNIQLWHLNGRCPRGTIPIRRTKQEDILRASSIDSFVKKKQKNSSQLPLATKLLNRAAHEVPICTCIC
ncbi:hypothetical protein ACH5RR_000858 [Cinchona calisaya]|uniref:Neprosin activation peptide domain-containing protein n=1 Tax=Cinchona calisaya TaxID=153742 RepID=A0ABD3B2Y5_9GENT